MGFNLFELFKTKRRKNIDSLKITIEEKNNEILLKQENLENEKKESKQKIRKLKKEHEEYIKQLQDEVKKKINETAELTKNLEKLKKQREKENKNYKSEKKNMLEQIKKNINSIAKLEKEIQEMTTSLEEQKEKMELVASIINKDPQKNEALEEFKALLEKDYINYANENDNYAEEAGALKRLQKVEQELEFISFDTSLVKKTVVAIAGSFSSGKSSFMNSFFESKKINLPTGMDQTTAISSYVISDKKPQISCCSWRGSTVEVPTRIFNLFTYNEMHEFHVNMKQIVQHFIFRNKFVEPFDHICFIDTPGFNPGKETESDYESAIRGISNSSLLLWCFDASAGTIKEDEIKNLEDIFQENNNIKIYVIINKADQKSIEENIEIMSYIDFSLENRIPIEGITLYSSKNRFNEQEEEYADRYKKKSLKNFLKENDIQNTHKEESLLQATTQVFYDYINANLERITKFQNERKKLFQIERIFNEILDENKIQIDELKARTDRRFKKSIYENVKKYEENNDLKEDELMQSFIEIKRDRTKIINKDKADTVKAKEILFKMQQAISKIFGHNRVEPYVLEENENYYNNLQKKEEESTICEICGAQFEKNAQYCSSCGEKHLIESDPENNINLLADTLKQVKEEKKEVSND